MFVLLPYINCYGSSLTQTSRLADSCFKYSDSRCVSFFYFLHLRNERTYIAKSNTNWESLSEFFSSLFLSVSFMAMKIVFVGCVCDNIEFYSGIFLFCWIHWSVLPNRTEQRACRWNNKLKMLEMYGMEIITDGIIQQVIITIRKTDWRKKTVYVKHHQLHIVRIKHTHTHTHLEI